MIFKWIDALLYGLALAVSRKAREQAEDLENARFNLSAAYEDLDAMGKIVDELIGGYELPATLVTEFQAAE